MNQDLRDRFDGLQSSSDDPRLDWSAIGPIIQEGVAARERRWRRKPLMWCLTLGFAGLIAAAFFLFYFNTSSNATSEGPTVELAVDPKARELSVRRSDTQSRSARMSLGSTAGEVLSRTTTPSRPAAAVGKSLRLTSTIESAGHSISILPNAIDGSTRPTYTSVQRPPSDSESEQSVPLTTPDTASTGRELADPSPRDIDLPGSILQPILQRLEAMRRPTSSPNIAKLSLLTLQVFPEENVGEGGNKLGPIPSVKRPSYSPWSITLAAGVYASRAAEAYGQTDDHPGFAASAHVERQWRSGWLVGAGVQYASLEFSTAATLVDTVREFRPDQVSRVYRYSNGGTAVEYVDSIAVERTRRSTRYNTHTEYTLPVFIGRHWSQGPWHWGVRAGGQVVFRQNLHAGLLSAERTLQAVDVTQTGLRIAPMVGGNLGYALSPTIGLHLAAGAYRTSGVTTAVAPNVGGVWVGQLQIGLRWRVGAE